MTHDTTDAPTPALERLPTGIPGMDEILRGGLLKGGVYIVQGTPGAGKTIFANQICFGHVAKGAHAVYVTLLAESHSRMLQHLRSMSFFDAAAIPERLYYVSGYRALEEEGLKGLVDLLRREIRGHGATMLVVDGLLAVEEMTASANELKKFINDIQTHAAVADCTVLLLTNGGQRGAAPEHTMVDGLIVLDDQLFTVRTERSLQVRKFRGSGFLRGRHTYRITEQGIVLYPRLEAALALPSPDDDFVPRRIVSGIDDLDDMFGGGLPAASTTALMGPTGSGKTTLGMHFLAKANAAEPGLLFGFYETPARLRAKAASFGIDFVGLELSGALEIIWYPQGENFLDELGHRLLAAVRRRNVRRLFLDGLTAMAESALHPERISRFFSVLANELRALHVTTLYSVEMEDVLGSQMKLPIKGVSSLVENMIVQRYVEIGSRTHRLISVTKARDSDFDHALREYRISAEGIRIGAPFKGFEALLSGFGRRPSGGPFDPGRPPRKGAG